MTQVDDYPGNKFHQPIDFNPWANDGPPEEARGRQALLAPVSEAGPSNGPGSPRKPEVATPAPSDVPAGQKQTGSSQKGKRYTSEQGSTRCKSTESGRILEKANCFLRDDLDGFLQHRWHELYRDGLFRKGKEEIPIFGVEALLRLKEAKTDEEKHPLGTLRYNVALIRNFIDILVEEKKSGANVGITKQNKLAYDKYIEKYCPNADNATREKVRDLCRYARRWFILIDGDRKDNRKGEENDGGEDDPDKVGLGTGVLLVCSDTLMNTVGGTSSFSNPQVIELRKYIRHHRQDIVKICLIAQEPAANLLSGYGTVRKPFEAMDAKESETALKSLLARLAVRAKLE